MRDPLPRRPPQLPAAAAAGRCTLPERVLQFGEGNFLRAFVDWMLERMNRAGHFQGGAVVIQPLPHGMASLINEQEGFFTVALRGIRDGKRVDSRELVSAVTRCIDPWADFPAFLRCATNPETRFVVSNTTEAGIRLDPSDAPDARPATSFPGKLTQLLHERFRHFRGDPARGWIMLPCELVDRNGDTLRRAVLDTAESWRLSPGFRDWIDTACLFTNTLVDRIVTGYPDEDAPAIQRAIGWEDRLLVAAEPYHTWIIESPRPLEDDLPLQQAGLDVVWTNDVTPYRDRKVRILNGAHTMAALVGHLAGLGTVAACMDDEQIRTFLEAAVIEDILPTLQLPAADVSGFARSTFERFRNPYLRHRLLDIALNSTSKFRARLLDAMESRTRATGRLPQRLAFSLAALMAFYRGDEIRGGAIACIRAGEGYPARDEPAALSALQAAWSDHARGPLDPSGALRIVTQILRSPSLWGRDLTARLPGIERLVAGHLAAICSEGMRAALHRL